MNDLEYFIELLDKQNNWLLRPIQGSNVRIEIYKDGDMNNHSPDNEIRIYFCHGKMNQQYK